MQWNEPKLLIADDDRDFRESLGEIFRRRGFVTRLAADGCEAVEIVKSSQQLHLVILDVHMPKLSGLQALERIRELAIVTLPCVLMSAKLDDAIIARAQQLEISSLLAKPFSLREVTSAVEAVLKSSYGWVL